MSKLADQLEQAVTNMEWSNPQPTPVHLLLRDAANRLREFEVRVDSLDASDHWQYFNWNNISSEATQRLTLYMKTTDSDKRVPEMETYAYWCAWAAHTNAAARLIPAAPPAVK